MEAVLKAQDEKLYPGPHFSNKILLGGCFKNARDEKLYLGPNFSNNTLEAVLTAHPFTKWLEKAASV